ncbi:MAG: hypothetical protein ACJAUP_003141 [Cellvibrionaceae bacterium]|jgi:hypothetical protein
MDDKIINIENHFGVPEAGLPTEFINLLSLLIRHPSVVGAEHSFFLVLQRELEERVQKSSGMKAF